jgi:uncharacterized protein YegL
MNKPVINKVFNLIILDESGSMESIKQATINGFNELIQSIKHSLKDFSAIEQYVNFFSFNGQGIKEHLPLCRAEHLNFLSAEKYVPDHMTPLYDAIGFTVNQLKKAIENETQYSVLVTILTDGEENNSKEYRFEDIAALIGNMRSKGWVFTYIGANHNVEQTAVSLNINNHLQFEATEEDTEQMFEKNNNSRKKYMNKIQSGLPNLSDGFFKDDQ